MGQGTDVAIICHYGSVCYEYLCIRSTEWILTISISISQGPTQSDKSLIPQDTQYQLNIENITIY